jgi:hypothetical protein
MTRDFKLPILVALGGALLALGVYKLLSMVGY